MNSGINSYQLLIDLYTTEVALATRDWSGQLKLPIRSKKKECTRILEYIVILGQFIIKMVTMLHVQD